MAEYSTLERIEASVICHADDKDPIRLYGDIFHILGENCFTNPDVCKGKIKTLLTIIVYNTIKKHGLEFFIDNNFDFKDNCFTLSDYVSINRTTTKPSKICPVDANIIDFFSTDKVLYSLRNDLKGTISFINTFPVWGKLMKGRLSMTELRKLTYSYIDESFDVVCNNGKRIFLDNFAEAITQNMMLIPSYYSDNSDISSSDLEAIKEEFDLQLWKMYNVFKSHAIRVKNSNQEWGGTLHDMKRL